MSTLYQQIDLAKRFQAEPDRQAPQVDQSAQAQLGQEWAKRQADRPKPEPIRQTPTVLPIPN